VAVYCKLDETVAKLALFKANLKWLNDNTLRTNLW